MSLNAEFLGRLHPLLLHFPIALLWVAGVVEILRLKKDSLFLSRCMIALMAIGAISALLASGSGWLLAAHENIRKDELETLFLHRWLGVATTVVGFAGWFAAARWRESATRGQVWTRRLLIWISTGLLTAAAHYGATIVWGSDWLTP